MVRLKAGINTNINNINTFQFLMVRLKVVANNYDYKKYSFQFLMVRLKELWDWLKVAWLQNFNSLWCD